MSFIAWIILGLLAGFIGSKLVNKGRRDLARHTAGGGRRHCRRVAVQQVRRGRRHRAQFVQSAGSGDWRCCRLDRLSRASTRGVAFSDLGLNRDRSESYPGCPESGRQSSRRQSPKRNTEPELKDRSRFSIVGPGENFRAAALFRRRPGEPGGVDRHVGLDLAEFRRGLSVQPGDRHAIGHPHAGDLAIVGEIDLGGVEAHGRFGIADHSRQQPGLAVEVQVHRISAVAGSLNHLHRRGRRWWLTRRRAIRVSAGLI